MAAVIVTSVGICAALTGIRDALSLSRTAAAMERSRHVADSVYLHLRGLPFRDPETAGTFGPEEASAADYDDLDDYNGFIQSPPIDEQGAPLTDFAGWTERVFVKSIDPITLEEAADGTTRLLLFEVDIERNGNRIGVYQWLKADF